MTIANSKIACTEDGIFHTVQGEGRFTGVPSIFLRLSGCNLRCAWTNTNGTMTKCDTPYSSYDPERNIKTVNELAAQIADIDCTHVVITGGEPFMQKNLGALIDYLVTIGRFVTIETNGTIYWNSPAQFMSISPKLSTSTYKEHPHFTRHDHERFNRETLNLMMRNHDYQLKFVVNYERDLEEIEAMLEKLDFVDASKIYLMPQGVSREQFDSKLPWIVEAAKKRNWNVTDRLHVRIWGPKRGV